MPCRARSRKVDLGHGQSFAESREFPNKGLVGMATDYQDTSDKRVSSEGNYDGVISKRVTTTPFSVAFVPVHSQRRSDVRVSTVQFALLSLLDCTKVKKLSALQISYAPLIYVMPPTIDEHVWSTAVSVMKGGGGGGFCEGQSNLSELRSTESSGNLIRQAKEKRRVSDEGRLPLLCMFPVRKYPELTVPDVRSRWFGAQKRQGFHRALLPRRCGHLGHRAEFTGADQRQAPTAAFLGNSGVLLHIPSVLQTDLTRWIDPLCGPSTNQGSSAGPSCPFFLALDLNTFSFFSRRRSMGDMQRRLSGCYDQYHEYPKAHNSSRPAIVVDEVTRPAFSSL
ncbi:conserved hypothetical protein [Coccidioides posadasii str. Silveira]|uniref:Uncharacterized protein n=1 Tax=Coccidioides posadasii (strain RMSCC 757 / Silveira) TaxID=443226 RepID=E9CT77_COCPS|nr:conserved hypothetical protein [Coccidioides posadasii str. Silveira]